MLRRALVVVVLVCAVATVSPVLAAAQDQPPAVADPDIIPRPNTGRAPTESGDRGGALQLLVLGVLVVTVGGAATHLVRSSRRARSRSA